MSELTDTANRIREGQTWTERIYYVSPLMYAALKSLPIFKKRSARKARQANARIGMAIDKQNDLALAALGVTSDAQVQNGPFKGMHYLRSARGSVLGPKIAGSYESEISSWFDRQAISPYVRAVDIGAAEGYYAVGLATSCNDLRVYAYDVDQEARASIAALAKMNGVSERVEIGGLCDPETLQSILSQQGRSLLIVDIEGFEYDLIDPAAVPALGNADIILELHEHARPGVSWRILERFTYSHDVEIVAATPDDVRIRNSIAGGMPDRVAELCAREHRRLPQLWMKLTSRDR